jgi:membrane protein
MKHLLERLRSSWPGRFAKAYGDSNTGGYAAGLAFNGFMSMFPLILGLLAVVGLIVRDDATQSRLQDVVVGVFPPDAHGQILDAFRSVRRSAGLVGLVAIGGLVWGGTGFFSSLEFALTQIFGTRQRNLLRQRAMGALMMLVLLAALLIAAGANAAAGVAPPASTVLGFVVGAAVLVGLLTLVYRYVPNRSFPLPAVLPGALAAGVLVELVSLVFPVYARFSHGFNTYGQQFAVFFLLATWLYLLSQLLLLGAVFNRMRLGPPSLEGAVAEPGDRGEPPPTPAEAIESERAEHAEASRRR